MKSITAGTKILYDAALAKKGVPLTAHFYYRKWLKYYLDFCLKYHRERSKKGSLPYFLQKLKNKNQTEEQRKQAFHAVSIYYELKNIDHDKIPVIENKKEIKSSKNENLKLTKADWRPVYNDLDSEIRLRHYSPKMTMIYTHTIQSRTIKEAESPLDF